MPGQVEPDCMTALVMLGAYLLLFRSDRLWASARPALVIGITGLAVACHPSHLGLIGGLADLRRAAASWRLRWHALAQAGSCRAALIGLAARAGADRGQQFRADAAAVSSRAPARSSSSRG